MLSDDIEPHSVDECRRITYWSNWKQAIQVKLISLAKCKVFRPIASTPPHVKHVGYKWVFVQKHNEKNKIVRYKARLVMQGFSQRPKIDYDENYSPVMDVITFRYLINLKSHFGFVIVAVYVDDMNLIGTLEELARTATHLKSEFEMKDLGLILSRSRDKASFK
ncbi:hypothetical protein ACFX2B_007573 [Malus domestica]